MPDKSEIEELERKKRELEDKQQNLATDNKSAMLDSGSQLYFLPVNSPVLREQREQHALVV